LGILDLDLLVKGTDPDSDMIRILPSSSKIVRKILDFNCFVTSLWRSGTFHRLEEIGSRCGQMQRLQTVSKIEDDQAASSRRPADSLTAIFPTSI
jgi:hypothetical protein